MQIVDPTQSAGYVLWQLNHVMQQRMTEALAEIGLTLPQLGALIHIAREDAVSTADLARVILMTQQNMSLTVARLVKLGFLARRPHETHGRIQRLEATKAGLKVLIQAVEIMRGVEEEMFGALSETARKTLVKQLQSGLTRLTGVTK